eukprot:TRINITY_DN65786_c9_g1_i1.p1 TRINITY_DN65786_c9_g1~~TRINITY_DN65786_c9_g1_i1.p1  ORF type:complete len:541 (-),score=40.28 TRINITY_DN65786_c9_g1_i1:137-1759(-)
MGCCTSVPEHHAAILEKSGGNFSRVLGPGNHVVMPCVETVTGMVDLGMRTVNVKLEARTKEYQFVSVEVVIQFRVMDDPGDLVAQRSKNNVHKAFYGLPNPEVKLQRFISTCVQAHCQRLPLHHVLQKRDVIANEVKDEVVPELHQYGYLVQQLSITQLHPSNGSPTTTTSTQQQQQQQRQDKPLEVEATSTTTQMGSSLSSGAVSPLHGADSSTQLLSAYNGSQTESASPHSPSRDSSDWVDVEGANSTAADADETDTICTTESLASKALQQPQSSSSSQPVNHAEASGEELFLSSAEITALEEFFTKNKRVLKSTIQIIKTERRFGREPAPRILCLTATDNTGGGKDTHQHVELNSLKRVTKTGLFGRNLDKVNLDALPTQGTDYKIQRTYPLAQLNDVEVQDDQFILHFEKGTPDLHIINKNARQVQCFVDDAIAACKEQVASSAAPTQQSSSGGGTSPRPSASTLTTGSSSRESNVQSTTRLMEEVHSKLEQRGEKLRQTAERSERMRSQANDFLEVARQLRERNQKRSTWGGLLA